MQLTRVLDAAIDSMTAGRVASAAMRAIARPIAALPLALVLAAGCSGAPGASAPAASAVDEPSVTVAIQGMALVPAHFSVPEGRPFRIVFENEDSQMAHALAIERGTSDVWRGTPVQGPGTATYEVPALPGGTYTVYCQVHFGITGVLDAVPFPMATP